MVAYLEPQLISFIAFAVILNDVYALSESTSLQLQSLSESLYKLRAKRHCQMGECGPEEYFMICRKCPICCLDSLQQQVSTMSPPSMPPINQPPQCCKTIPVPVPVPVPVIRPQQNIVTENPSTQCCMAPRPSPTCCQAPATPSPPEIVLCCQLRPEPANPCCQAAAAAGQGSQNKCVCSAPRPVPCRCSAPPQPLPSGPSSSAASELECALGACPVFIARCPMSPAAPQPAACKRPRFRRDAYQSLLQQLSHNVPFEI